MLSEWSVVVFQQVLLPILNSVVVYYVTPKIAIYQKYSVMIVGRIRNNNFELVDHDLKTIILIILKTLKLFIKTHLKPH